MSKFHFSGLLTVVAVALSAWLLGGVSRWIVPGAIILIYLFLLSLGVILMRLQFFCPVFFRGACESKQVALTFDDGPDPDSTPALLDLLREKGLPATFFCVGQRVEKFPEIVRRMQAEGHTIGNHTYAHSGFTNFYRTSRLVREISRASDVIEKVTGVRPEFYRPPVGLSNPNLARAVKRLNMTVVGWQCGLGDRRAKTSGSIVNRILKKITGGGIIALHDQGVPTEKLIATVSQLIDGVGNAGYKFVGLEQLREEQR
jgi:peptidoglycan-N-acetylglucosamine deacetylase